MVWSETGTVKKLPRYNMAYTLVLLKFALDIVLGDVGLLMPSVLLGRLINLSKLLLRRSNLVSGLLRGVRGDITDEHSGIAH